MEKEVTIYIKGTQVLPGGAENGQQEVQELYVKGTCYRKNEKWYVFYEEDTGEAGSQPVKCALRFTPEQLLITRKGQVDSSLTLRPLEKTQNLYRSPLGMMELGCDTKVLRIQETDCEIVLYAEYGLELNGTYVSDNQVEIRIQ